MPTRALNPAEQTMVRGVARLVRARAYKAHLAQGAYKTQGAFELHVWAYMREFFTSQDPNAAFAFIDSMAGEIENQWTRAWNEGARSVGVDPREFDDEDITEIEGIIRGETDYLGGVAGDIEAAKAEGLTDEEFNGRFRNRAFMWANRYNEVVDHAKIWFSNRQKFEWVMGPTEEHCHTGDDNRPGVGCANLSGLVLWAREWDQAGIRPQSDALNCGGWQCQCRLEATDTR